MKKLYPSIKLNCPACQALDDLSDIGNGFNIKPQEQKVKVKTIIGKRQVRSTKVNTLF